MNKYPEFYTLNNGIKIPVMGMGTDSMKNISEVIYSSIKSGTRLIDTAARYGNEKEIGIGINKALNEGIVKREDLYIITKLNPIEKDDPEKAIKESLEKLNLSYVDLYLDHWPSGDKFKDGKLYKAVPVHYFWPIIESFVSKGYTKSIGVSNYNVQSLLNILSFCKIKPAVNEIEFHPYLYQKNLVEFCKAQGIQVIAYNSLIRGNSVQTYKDKFKDYSLNLLEEDVIKEMAKKYNTTEGLIALNWSISQDLIVIPRTSNPNRMSENLKAKDFRMSKEDIEKISKLNKNQRFNCSYIWDSYMGVDLFA